MPRTTSSFKAETLSAPTTPAIYASAKNFSVGKARQNFAATTAQRVGDEWQDIAWDFYDVIPEYRYSVDWVGNLLSKAALTILYDGAPTTNADAVEALNSLFGGPEGQQEMFRQFGIHFTVAGEAHIFGVADEDGDEDDWFVAASSEVRRDANNNFTVGQGSEKFEVKSSGAMVIRIWRPHPRRPRKSNSPSRAVLPILSELDKLAQHVAAQLDSRLAGAGLLLLPSQMSFPVMPTETDAEGNAITTPVDGAQGFLDMVSRVMAKAIADRSSASAHVPIILQVDGDYIDKIQHLTFWTDLDENAEKLRTEAIRRLALGMDMPPEVLTGATDVNHWGMWQIDESAIKSHSEPLLNVLRSALTHGYLWAVLEFTFGMDRAEARRYSFGVDTSGLRTRPNRSKEAVELYDRGELSAVAMRRENGFSEDDAMTEDDRKVWLTKQLASGQTTPDLVAQGLQLLGVNVTIPEADETHEQRPTRSLTEHPTRDMPDESESEAADPSELMAAASMAVGFQLRHAGNRLKNSHFAGRAPSHGPVSSIYMGLTGRLEDAAVDKLIDPTWECLDWALNPVDRDALVPILHSYVSILLTTKTAHHADRLREHIAASLHAGG